MAWLRAAGSGVEDPLVGRVLGETEGTRAEVLLLGNSVTEASLDVEALAAALDREVAQGAMSGALPPHWLALLRHRVYGSGGAPAVVLLYVPAHNLRDTDVSAASDQALLVSLLTSADAELLAHAELEASALGDSGAAVGGLARLQHDRQRARDSVLFGLRDLGLRLAPAEPEAAARALETLTDVPGPNAAEDRFQATPGQASPGQGPGARGGPGGQRGGTGGQGRAGRLEESVFPDLVAEVQAGGGRLVVVHPAARPDVRPPCTGEGLGHRDDDWLLREGVDVLDLTFADLASRDFSNQHHLGPEGQAALTGVLAQALGRLDPWSRGPTAPGRRLVLDCEGRLGG